MEPDQITTSTDNRPAAMAALAAVGFIALVAFGMWLAIYSSRYVPGTVSRIGSAAVALSSIFTPSPSTPSGLATTTTPTTIPFGDGTSTSTATKPVTVPQPGTQTSGTYPISGGIAPADYSGLPDLSVSIMAVGYLTTNSTSSFVPATSVPAGYRPAVQFTVKNIGTNVAGAWEFSASIPTQTAYMFNSLAQQALNPGDSIDYTLGFDDASVGTDETITVTANSNHAISESNTANDIATAVIAVQ